MNPDRSLIARLGAGLAVLALLAVAWFSYQAATVVQRVADADERSASALERSADADERSASALERSADADEEQTCWTNLLANATRGSAVISAMGSPSSADSHEWIRTWDDNMADLAAWCHSLP